MITRASMRTPSHISELSTINILLLPVGRDMELGKGDSIPKVSKSWLVACLNCDKIRVYYFC
jgi:hypothetical protein